MKHKRIYIEIFYLLLLGVTLGGVLVLGALVAPVVFNTASLFSVPLLDHYHEGIIMAEVFRRFAYWANIMAALVVLFEIYEYKQLRYDAISIIAAFAVVGTLLLFSGVYTPKILALQQEGVEATMSEAFANLHAASEIDFKLLALALAVLFFRRVLLMRRMRG